MEYLVTAEKMREYDNNTSDYFKIPSIVLMEKAAMVCVEEILSRQRQLERAAADFGCPVSRRVLVAAGSGNNGGDGFAIGRLLMQEGFLVDFLLVGNEEKTTEQTKLQIASVRAYGGEIMRIFPEKEYDIIIDALFGVGLTRDLEGIYKETVERINKKDAYVLSVDIPSGIHADSGKVMGAAVRADVTVTFGFYKLGCVLYPGTEYCGRLICRPIGITQESFLGNIPDIFTFDEKISELMPQRPGDGNKGTFGKVTLLAAKEGMAGAGILAGKGAFYAGCGMVKLVTANSNTEVIMSALPEAMVTGQIEEAQNWADVIAAGPGLSCSKEAQKQLEYIIFESKKPLILDADAINILAQNRELLTELINRQHDPAQKRLLALTPHPGELARLHECSIGEVLGDPFTITRFWSEKLNAAVLCKGARTIAALPDGRFYVNRSGNSGMATAGSGDVLTGIMAALAAAGDTENFYEYVCISIYLHGLAGDQAAHVRSKYSMTAGNIAEMIPLIFTE